MSIKIPNKAVPKAVAKTIKAVVNALIDPRCLTPYSSAQVEEPNILANPFAPAGTFSLIPILSPKAIRQAQRELQNFSPVGYPSLGT